MYRMLLQEDVASYDLGALKYCTTAGEALPPEVFKAWKRATGVTMMEGFGQTETTVVICNTRGMTPKPGSLGRPSPQYRVGSWTRRRPLSGRVTGEIVIAVKYGKPDGLMAATYLDEQKTAEASDGWYHTGDTTDDEDGYYWSGTQRRHHQSSRHRSVP